MFLFDVFVDRKQDTEKYNIISNTTWIKQTKEFLKSEEIDLHKCSTRQFRKETTIK